MTDRTRWVHDRQFYTEDAILPVHQWNHTPDRGDDRTNQVAMTDPDRTNTRWHETYSEIILGNHCRLRPDRWLTMYKYQIRTPSMVHQNWELRSRNHRNTWHVRRDSTVNCTSETYSEIIDISRQYDLVTRNTLTRPDGYMTVEIPNEPRCDDQKS